MSPIAPDWVARHAMAQPDSAALTNADTGAALTWAELEGRVARLAYVLRHHYHLRRGDRLVLVAENDLRVFEVQFACMRTGVVLVPLNWRLARGELQELTEDASPRLIVHDPTWATVAGDLHVPAKVRRLAWGPTPGADDYEGLLAEARELPANDEATLDDVTHILYTSGTTGRPKGVLCTQGTLAWHAINLARDCRMAERGNHHLNIVPLSHAGGLNVYTNPILYWGGHVTTTVRFDPVQTLELLTDPSRGITHLCGVLQMYEPIMALPEFDRATFPALRCILFGAWGPAVPAMYPRWRNRGFVVHTSYGGTEVGPLVTFEDGEDPALIEEGSSGRPFLHQEIRLCDAVGDEVCPGEVGELCVRGPSVTPGYWNRDHDENFFGDWFRTGDAAHGNGDGRYFIVDRIKEMYRSGGENVFPAEVETVLGRIPGVRELAVIGIPDPRWGEVGMAFIVADQGVDITLEAVRDFGSMHLARFKLPQHIACIDELPRNVTGKVARDELRRRAAVVS